MTTSHELFHEVAGLGRQLRAAIPEVYAGYIPVMISFTSGTGSCSPVSRSPSSTT